MECLECGQTYSTDSMATAKQCSGCARIEALEAENAALWEAADKLLAMRSSITNAITSAHSERTGSTEWMIENDRDFRCDLRRAFDKLRAALARQTEGEG